MVQNKNMKDHAGSRNKSSSFPTEQSHEDDYIPFSDFQPSNDSHHWSQPPIWDMSIMAEDQTPFESLNRNSLVHDQTINPMRSVSSTDETFGSNNSSMSTNKSGSLPSLDAKAQELRAKLHKQAALRATETSAVPSTNPANKQATKSDNIKSSIRSSTAKTETLPRIKALQSSTVNSIDELLSETKASMAMKSKAQYGVKQTKAPERLGERQPQSAKVDIRSTDLRVGSSMSGDDANNKNKGQSKPYLKRQEASILSSPNSEGEIHDRQNSANRGSESGAGAIEAQDSTKQLDNDQKLNKKLGGRQLVLETAVARGPTKSTASKEALSRTESIFKNNHPPASESIVKSEKQDLRSNDQNASKRGSTTDADKPSKYAVREHVEAQPPREPIYQLKKQQPDSQQAEPLTLERLMSMEKDLKDWLDYTGYHNAAYRDKTLSRRRKLVALDEQKAIILEEIEKEQRDGHSMTYTSNATFVPHAVLDKSNEKAAREDGSSATIEKVANPLTKTPTKAKRSYSDYQSSYDREDSCDRRLEAVDRRALRVKQENEDVDRRSRAREYDTPPRRSSYDYYDYRSPFNEDRGRDDRRRASAADRERSSALYDSHRAPLRERSYSLSYNRSSRPPQDKPWEDHGRYRGRNYDPDYHYHPRNLKQPDRTSGEKSGQIAKGSKSKSKGKGDTRYFIIKSFNDINVRHCMDDSIWVTQPHNGEKFKKAFLECENVMLVFSVNSSHAFQGYARMENIPGSEPMPAWQYKLNWETSGAFRLSWITIASTSFNLVGHLKNSLNEGHPVLVGKDGQEIEEKCGEGLCKIIDQEAESAGGRRWHLER